MIGSSKARIKHNRCIVLALTVTAALCLSIIGSTRAADSSPKETTQPISSRLAFLRAQRAAAASRQTAQQQTPKNETSKATEAPPLPPNRGTAVTAVSATQEALKPVVNQLATTAATVPKVQPSTSNQQQAVSNRTARTADVFQNGDGFNIFVTNTCERELMRVNIKTSRPFFGAIHTRNQRQKAACTVEGDGDTEYNLDISHVLNQQDPNYCGVVKARKESPEDKDLLSVVLAVRVHRNIELSDDKFFLLNCTNRCRRPDCSPPPARLTNGGDDTSNARISNEDIVGERENAPNSEAPRRQGDKGGEDECTVWKFPWLITLLWCMAILLLAMIISHCIMCSSLICRCVKTEVEEREPSVYEGATDLDDEDSLYNKKTHPMRIDYDNRDIYKTSNNYKPYTLDDDCREQDQDDRRRSNKRRHKSAR